MPTITITLEQLGKFLDRLNPDYGIRRLALLDARDVLLETFENNIFTNHGDVDYIPTKSDLRRLIKAKAQAPSGKPYNEEYLKRKRRMGEHQPHKYENYGFFMGTDIKFDSGRVIMQTKPLETSTKDFDYLSLHESQRSVLKATFLRSWQRLIDVVINRYKIEAQK